MALRLAVRLVFPLALAHLARTLSRCHQKPRGLLIASSLLLSACGSLAPSYERPPAPIATRFPSTQATDAASPAAADLPWAQMFADERMRKLIDLALINNRDLRVAVLNIEQARAQLGLREADVWPTINVGVSGNRQPTANGSTRFHSAGLQVTAYELDFFGRIRSLTDVAAAQLLAGGEARKAVQISLVGNVANAFIALQADEQQLRVTRETLTTRESSVALVKLRFDNGASSELDLRAVESLREAARVTYAQQARQRALDENALTLLVGQPLSAELLPARIDPSAAVGAAPFGPSPQTGSPTSATASTTLAPEPSVLEMNFAPAIPDVPAGLPSDVLIRRPDVRQAELQLIAANANIGAARAAFFPRITLTGSAGVASGELSALFSGGNFAWSFAPQLLQPLFDVGRNRANLAFAKAGRDIAVAQYERAIQSAFREVADALAGRATLAEQADAQQAQVQAEQGRFRLASLRYQSGASSYLDLLDAQRSLFSAQLALVQVRAQLAQNAVTLYRVLGGGWTEGERGG